MSVLLFVLRNLNFLIQKEVGLLLGVDKEMNKLSSTLSTIQAVLEDAEHKQFQDKAIQNWLRKLKDEAYEVDDLLDDCATHALKWESKGLQSSGTLKKVSTSVLDFYPNTLFRHKIGNRIKEITEKLDAIADERIKFHFHENIVEKPLEFAERRETGSALTQPQVYGREEDKEKIVTMLLSEDVCDRQEVSIYPIIGMGGLGKTTLAQMVFNDERVNSHFEPTIWVYVSEDFDVKRVIKAILETMSRETCKASDLDSLQQMLRDMLKGKRYLLVLDDMWDENQEKWDNLKGVLACGSKGASVIVTTRLEKVATITGTLPLHHLSLLSEDNCWLLFRQRAFGHGNEERPNLVAIGREIVKKCGGVPLAAKALGSQMCFRSEEKYWLFIKESEIWNIPQNESSILPALKLSYFNLPLELRQCFAYCAVFLKGSKIEKKHLIHLWMANGFILSKGNLELEDIGSEIWNELHWRSFFQDVGKDEFGDFTFRLHDLMHDLAQSVMEDDCHVMEAFSSSYISKEKIHHVTLVAMEDSRFFFPEALQKAESVRTILVQYRESEFVMHYTEAVFKCHFSNFGSLRVFDARYTRLLQLSSSIGNSKHLRYLNLSHTDIRTLPKSICSLHNLQTLNLNHCYKLQNLPKNMKRLRSLRHLYLKSCLELHDMPPNLGQLTSLKTLSLYAVSKGQGHHLAELQSLDLGGELRIQHLERVRNSADAKDAYLVGKRNLRVLELSWVKQLQNHKLTESQANVEQLLEALEPHPNLEELVINNFTGVRFPRWMEDSGLENIVDIRLSGCINCLILPAFGQLPSLRCLSITSMVHVEYIDNDFPGGGPVKGFPSLEELEIYNLPNLKGLSREEGRELLPRLRKITINFCLKLTLPHLSSLESLNGLACSTVLLGSITKFNCLTSLIVSFNKHMISLPEGMLQDLTALQSLRIHGFSKLEVLPMNLASLTSLRKLDIAHCNNLSSLSESLGYLTALEKLDISGCPKLETLPESIKHLNSLRHLIIRGHPTSWSSSVPVICAKLKTLPEALQHIPALESLEISKYPELTSLPEWLGNLTSLHSLTINGCPKIPSLPQSFQSLTKLQTLSIEGNGPELTKRCEKGKGEDWYKIAHIPEVHLD